MENINFEKMYENLNCILNTIKKNKNGKNFEIVDSSILSRILISIELLKDGGLFVVPNEIQAENFKKIFMAFRENVYIFPKKDLRNFSFFSENIDTKLERMASLEAIILDKRPLIIAPIESLIQPIISKDELKECFKKIKIQDEINIEKFIKYLLSMGYTKMDIADVQGSFSIRGGILDIAIDKNFGYRIELFDNIVDRINQYDYLTQRTKRDIKISSIDIKPLSENVFSYYDISKEEFKEKIVKNLLKKNFLIKNINEKEIDEIYDRVCNKKEASAFDEYIEYILGDFENIIDYFEKDECIIFNDLFESKERIENIFQDINLDFENSSGKNIFNNYFTYPQLVEKMRKKSKIIFQKSIYNYLYNEEERNLEFKNEYGFIIEKTLVNNTKVISENECENLFNEDIILILKDLLEDGKNAKIFQNVYIIKAKENMEDYFQKNEERKDKKNEEKSSRSIREYLSDNIEKISKNYVLDTKEKLKEYIRLTILKYLNTKIANDYLSREFEKNTQKNPEFFQKIIEKIAEKILKKIIFLDINYSLDSFNLSLKFINKNRNNNINNIDINVNTDVNTDINILDITKKIKSRPKKINLKKKVDDLVFSDLKVGDYVVHTFNGIGKFLGIETKIVDNISKDYIRILYNKGDVLFVPIYDLKNVKKYIATGSKDVKLSTLGTKEWDKLKQKAKNSLKEVADDLIELYSKRERLKGFAFEKDNQMQKEFEKEFKYVETDDQLSCINDIKKDMESDKIMDRLLCGDVGFGKTEVAMRAAFKAVNSLKQVAYIVPTTILAIQQEQTFKERMKNFPIRIESISRFKTKKEIEEILKDLKSGKIDIIIGTHRLLSEDVVFNNIGLLIVDEEHRFGVKAKEKLKKIKENVDVLTMSATPIPRTMYMSLSHIRDISVIYEPPYQRKSVKTYIIEYDDSIIKEAILKELERGGQVFYINNRIEQLEDIKKRLTKLIPEAKIGLAHGRMSSKELEQIMEEFVNKDIDILVCTTILESGIDIQNANTIIIEDSDKLGLAQLYQIRGRVGRSNRQAFAYICIKKNKKITEQSEKRLEAIKEFTELGSGMNIAIRDLEIRGAGSILGEIQHGNLDQVGYDTYQKLLSEVILEKQGKQVKEDEELIIDIGISAYIPNSYIKNQKYKMDIYRSIASCKDINQLLEIEQELIDVFGKYPKEVYYLLEIVKNKLKLLNKGIEKIALVNKKYIETNEYEVDIIINDKFKDEWIVNCINHFKSDFKIHNLGRKHLSIRLNINKSEKKDSNTADFENKILRILSDFAQTIN